MKKILIAIAFICIPGLVWLAFSYEPGQNPNVTPSATEAMAPEIALETQLGQVFMIGHWAHTPVASTTALIEKYQLGGVIIMSAPENPDEIKNWVNEWNSVSDIPLLIAIDQEGGPVTRLKGDAFIQTGQRDITSPEQAFEVGTTRGEELSNLGINLNFAPVLDTAHQSDSFMHSRTFPEYTNPVELADAMMRGLASHGVAGSVKHFPGHDDTSTDSHFALPVVNISESELATFAKPFSDIISISQPDFIMTAHVQFPNIDILPATLSPYFLHTYLRSQLEFTGIIITDDMSMDAIDENWASAEASKLALEAGANIILLAAEPESINTIYESVFTAANQSTALEENIKTSYLLIMEHKTK